MKLDGATQGREDHRERRARSRKASRTARFKPLQWESMVTDALAKTSPGQERVPPRPPAEPPRAALGSFLRAIIAFLEARKLSAQVRPLVSLETQRLIDKPPFVFRWVPSTPIDELEAALQKLGGPELCRELGLELSRAMGGTIVQPVLRAAFFLFGETPEAVFMHLDRFFSLPTRGITFSWHPLAPGSGLVEARFEGPDVPEAAYHVLQGSLQWVFDGLFQRPGTVGPPRLLSADARESRVELAVQF